MEWQGTTGTLRPAPTPLLQACSQGGSRIHGCSTNEPRGYGESTRHSALQHQRQLTITRRTQQQEENDQLWHQWEWDENYGCQVSITAPNAPQRPKRRRRLLGCKFTLSLFYCFTTTPSRPPPSPINIAKPSHQYYLHTWPTCRNDYESEDISSSSARLSI